MSGNGILILITGIRNLSKQNPSNVSVSVGTGETGSLVNSQLSEDEKTYQSAKQKVDNKELNAAIAEFMLYLEFFPEGKYVAQANYWMGELYMSLEVPEYENAIMHFEKVITDFPEHAKVPGCHYKLGVIYKEQGNTEKAKAHFETLVKNFPESSTADLAKNQLSSL